MIRGHPKHTRFYTSLTDAILPLIEEEGAALETFLPQVPIDAPEREMRCRVALAGTFLAGLELTRDGGITIQQSAPWTPIELRRSQASQ